MAHLPSRAQAETISKLRAAKERAELRLWFVEEMLFNGWSWPEGIAEYVGGLVDERDLADYELRKLLREQAK